MSVALTVSLPVSAWLPATLEKSGEATELLLVLQVELDRTCRTSTSVPDTGLPDPTSQVKLTTCVLQLLLPM